MLSRKKINKKILQRITTSRKMNKKKKKSEHYKTAECTLTHMKYQTKQKKYTNSI